MGRPSVYFVKYYDKGSTVMGAEQMNEVMREQGWDSHSIYWHQVGAVRNSILVFIKKAELRHLLAAKLHGNLCVVDLHDTLVFKRGIKFGFLYDGVIFRNDRSRRDFLRRSALCRTIYEQWDRRYSEHRLNDGEIRVGYLGEARSFPLWGELPEVECVPMEQVWERFRDFNVHLSIRRSGPEALYKANCKISTAAACGAVLVTSRDDSSVELLGEDYPFYTGRDPDSVRATLAELPARLGSADWREALRRLREVKERTSLDRIGEEYGEFFVDLERRRAA